MSPWAPQVPPGGKASVGTSPGHRPERESMDVGCYAFSPSAAARQPSAAGQSAALVQQYGTPGPSASATRGAKNGNVISTGQAKYRCRTGTKGSTLGMKSRQLLGSQRIQPEAVATRRAVPSHLGCNPHVWQELTRTALNQPLAWKMSLANPVTG
ncbi:uncharacterized protein LOC116631932 [Phoca vitulina]|uniref:uncharacterized protein LOC116631932 n=1 Tax=Phoca vitulina TaxID=9720 RepID=UPI0013965D68|nr:uncharacterized protein LOC116631932 [Phoca vitulina]